MVISTSRLLLKSQSTTEELEGQFADHRLWFWLFNPATAMESSILTYAIPVLFFAVFIRFLVQILRSPLRSVPGPFLARFTDGWYFWNVRKGSFQDVNVELHKKYGTLTCILTLAFGTDCLLQGQLYATAQIATASTTPRPPRSSTASATPSPSRHGIHHGQALGSGPSSVTSQLNAMPRTEGSIKRRTPCRPLYTTSHLWMNAPTYSHSASLRCRGRIFLWT